MLFLTSRLCRPSERYHLLKHSELSIKKFQYHYYYTLTSIEVIPVQVANRQELILLKYDHYTWPSQDPVIPGHFWNSPQARPYCTTNVKNLFFFFSPHSNRASDRALARRGNPDRRALGIWIFWDKGRDERRKGRGLGGPMGWRCERDLVVVCLQMSGPPRFFGREVRE